MKRLCFLALTAALAAGLAFGGGRSQTGSRGITFTVALSEDIAGVDPGVAWNYVTNQVTNQITEGLVTFGRNNEIVPELAKSWRQPDDLTYVYDVRDDVVFSDGTRMTMDDVLYSFERARDPEGGTWFADFFADVESFSVSGWQFTVKLKQPSAVFKYIPATGAGRIISKAYHQKHLDDFGSASGGIVGTGPFVYQPNAWISGQQISLQKNANYWDKQRRDANIIDTLVFKIIPDDTSRVIALQTGAADFSANLPEDQLDQLAGINSLTLSKSDSYRLTYVAFNTQRAPMSDLNVRKAVSRALDIPSFARNIIKNAGTEGTVLPFGPALYGENAAGWEQYLKSKPGYTYDLNAAKQFLAQSAYPNGFNCDLVVSENSLANQRALYIQEALRPLNINVNIRRMSGDEQDTYQMGGALDADGKRDYDMIIGGWEADYPDVDGNLGIMYASSQAGEGYNAAAYSKAAADALIESQRTTTDPIRRFALQSQLMEILTEDTAYIVFDYASRYSALNGKYSGVAVSPAWLWVLPFQNIRTR
jgi:peptide/nickel transport system substrate-binding protein